MHLFVAGDSHAVRINAFLAGHHSIQSSILAAKGGYNIEQCRQLLNTVGPTQNTYPIQIFLSIGSNEFLKGTYKPDITHKQFKSLIREINNKFTPKHLYICKIPLFPRFQHNTAMMQDINNFNAYISTFNTEKIITLNLPGITDNTDRRLFQPKFYNGKDDWIHLNNLEQERILTAITNKIRNSR
jgi:lysophospholipase L1-like esterase